MDLSCRKEQFSRAFVHAVASVAGFTQYQPEVDDDSIDVGFAARGGSGTCRSPRMEAQLKCTSQETLANDGIHFPVKVKNYDDLRATNLLVPRILIVTLVPEDIASWAELDEDRMLLRRCAWWGTLRGLPDKTNSDTVTVIVPRSNVLTPDALKALMAKISRGGLP